MGVGPQIKLHRISVSTGYAGGKEGSASINRDASVHSYLEAISPEHAYRVQPYVDIARTMAGQKYLKVDYSGEPGHYPGVSNWPAQVQQARPHLQPAWCTRVASFFWLACNVLINTLMYTLIYIY
jgi:hypothetical protein